jgi:FkbM family methyltransferase
MSDRFSSIRNIIWHRKTDALVPQNDQSLNDTSDYLSQTERMESELIRLRNIPRYTPTVTHIFGRDFHLVDSASFLFMYEEIFQKQIYKFAPASSKPLIIDGGANVGVSVLFFKWTYPESRIVAFEPDYKVFAALERNVANFELNNVTLINKALWSSETTLEFMTEGADAGRLCAFELGKEIYEVETKRLRELLTQPIDFLKLDIEGAETEVLKDSADLLVNVNNIFVEYHSLAKKSQTLHLITTILNKAGFRIHIHSSIRSPQPLLSRTTYLGMDMQLNIFGFRN